MAIERSRSLEGLLSSFETPQIFDPLTLIFDVNIDRHDANIAKRDEIQTNIRLLEAEMDILISKLATLKVPKRLNQGFYFYQQESLLKTASEIGGVLSVVGLRRQT